MAVEAATYISDLNTANPDGASSHVSELDDHVRLLKTTIKATLPNVTGAVTPTHTELNYVDGVTSAIQTQLNAKAAIAQEVVTAASLVNSWANQGGAYQNAEYWKDTIGNVHIHGAIKSGASGTVAFTLAAGYRPAAQQTFSVPGSNSGTIDIAAAGTVTITNITAMTSLSGITFRAA